MGISIEIDTGIIVNTFHIVIYHDIPFHFIYIVSQTYIYIYMIYPYIYIYI